MSSTIGAATFTIRGLFFSPDDDAVERLTRLLQQGVVGTLGESLGRLSATGRKAVGREIAAVAESLADLDLLDILVSGWRKLATLREAARRTAVVPGSQELVDLATHRITSIHRPFIEVLVDGVRVTTVNFELRLEFVVHGLVATVREGNLVSLDSGHCEVTGDLACEGIEVVKRRGEFDLGLIIRLDEGFPLISEIDVLESRNDKTPARHAVAHGGSGN